MVILIIDNGNDRVVNAAAVVTVAAADGGADGCAVIGLVVTDVDVVTFIVL